MRAQIPMRVLFRVSFLIVLAAIACSKRDASQNDRAGARSDSVVVVTSESNAPVVVRAAGLRFDPPSTWPRERYRVEARSGDGAAAEQAGAAHWVAIHYRPDQPGHREASLCRFVVFSRDTWARIDAEAGPPVGTLIERTDQWAFVAQLPQANPYPPESLDGAQFEAMRLSIREIRARFSIEGDGPDASRETGEL